MAKRGRPRHPDVLTPREWEVLALVREGLTNEQIGERLGITERTAKYHVSEILGKLGLRDRQAAAVWQPEPRWPWWATAVAPLGGLGRKLSFGWLSPAVAGGLALVAAAGVGALVWGVLATGASGEATVSASEVDAPVGLAWETEEQAIRSVTPAACGDAATANSYGVPMMLEAPGDRFLGSNTQPVLLGLEAEPYEFVADQVSVREDTGAGPKGWELSSRNFIVFGGHPNRFRTSELFLRRLDQPEKLFRYSDALCTQQDAVVAPTSAKFPPGDKVEQVPDNAPVFVVPEGADDSSLDDALDYVEDRYADAELVKAQLLRSGWSLLVDLGDDGGPTRPGHSVGLRISVYEGLDAISGAECCIDLVTSP